MNHGLNKMENPQGKDDLQSKQQILENNQLSC